MARLRPTIIIYTAVAIAFCLARSFPLCAQAAGFTSILALNLGLSDEKQAQLIKGWNAAMASGDVSVVIATINLIQSAPPELRIKILAQSRQSPLLPSLFVSLKPKERETLVSTLIRYPDIAAPLESMLSQELLTVEPSSSENLLYISDLVAVLKSLPQGDPAFFAQIIKREHSGSDEQVRQTYGSLLLGHSATLKALGSDLKPLLDSHNADEQQLAIQLILRLSLQIPQKQLDSALNDKEGLQPDAIRYLGKQPASLSNEKLKVLIPVLAQPATGDGWVAAYSVLQKKQPALLEMFFSQYKQQFDALAKLPPSTLLPILSALPSEQSGEIATWPLLDGNADGCEFAIANLMLIKRKSEVGGRFADSLWNVLQGKQDCSGDRAKLLELIDAILTSRPTSLEQFSSFLSGRTSDQHWDEFVAGLKTFTGWQEVYRDGGAGTSKLQLALIPVLRRFMDAGKTSSALELLRVGVPFTVDAAVSQQLLAKYHNKAALSNIVTLEMVGRLARPPQELISDIAAIAVDGTKESFIRKEAIDALAKIDSAASYYSTFLSMASGSHGLLSLSAINALTRLYAKSSQQLPLLSPSDEWLRIAATNEDTRTSASRLLEVLAQKNSAFAPLLLSSIPDPTDARCWDLAVVDTLSPRIWLTILDGGFGATEQRLTLARACVMLLTGNQSDAALIGSALTGSRSQSTPQSNPDRLALLSALSNVWKQTAGLNQIRKAIASQVSLLAPFLPYDVASQKQLRIWSGRLGKEYPDLAQGVKGQANKQTLVLCLLGVPLVVAAHFVLWLCLLVVYPHSTTVQSIVFWNKLVRKLLSLGYMDIILLSLPPLRRLLFLPLKEQMLGEVLQPSQTEFDRLAYFSNGRVKRVLAMGTVSDVGSQEPISNALRKLSQRTLLLGASGLGKSSFLRNLLTLESKRSDSAIYLPAGRCAGGVEEAIASRVHLFAQDRELLHALIYAGRLEVYIDGYNEVDPKTQEEIAGFIALFPKARILVTSQIPIRGLSRLETVELQPLSREDIGEFLIGRVPILPQDSLFSGDSFRKIATKYLDNLWKEERPSAEEQAIQQVLSNPMDLTTAAIVLANGKEPSLFGLQEQQFLMLQDKHLHRYQRLFRIQEFSEDIFQRRLNGDDDLRNSSYDREKASLLEEKMAMTRAVAVPGKDPIQEILFRHDRIRDYFTHFAFLEKNKDDRRFQYAGDSRFSGVYEYLAKVLDIGLAERLREQLLMNAVESQDHRLSDSFIKQLSWRQQFSSEDPKWLMEYDLPAAKEADLKFDALQESRSRLEREMLGLKTTMANMREFSRILTTFDESRFGETLVRCLSGIDRATVKPADNQATPHLKATSPVGTNFALALMCNRLEIDQFQIELVTQRIKQLPRPILLITNSNVAVDPRERPSDLPEVVCESFLEDGILCRSAMDVYLAYRSYAATHSTLFWSELEALWNKRRLGEVES
jgi:hypothetical protein